MAFLFGDLYEKSVIEYEFLCSWHVLLLMSI